MLLRPGHGVVQRLGPEQGLPSASVASLLLLPPPARTLWIGTYHGLAGYDLGTHRLRVLTTADGLATDELNRQSLWYDGATAHLYAGGVGGVSRVEVRAPVGTAYRPPLLLAALRQHHAAQDTTTTDYPAINEAVPLTLDPGDGFLDLSLALPDFAPGGAARFAYRLRSDEQARGARWLWFTGTPTLRLQNLAPGAYTIDIQAQTAAGTPARNRLHLPLTVRLPWQRRPAVWALAASLLAALVGGGVYAWQRAAAARRAAETDLRSRLAADLHDEVGALLTRVTLFAELAQADPEPALLEELLTESRSAAATVRDIIWSVDTAADTANALADRLHDLLDQAARASGRVTRFTLTPPTFDLTRRLRPDVRQHTYLIGREAVTNALKHGPAGASLHLHLTLDAAALVLEVRDENAPTALPTTTAPVGRGGQGLRNMRARAQQIDGTLEACAPLPTGGWVVRLRVPAPLM